MTDHKKILITGATGFIGANLARYFFKLGFDIHAFMRTDSDTWRIKGFINNIKTYRLDLTDAQAVEKAVLKIKPSYVLHSAVYGGYHFQKEAQKMISVNFLGTVNLLNACRNIDYKLFVNTGSSSEYGLRSMPMKESDILEPATDYGVSKAAATLYACSLARRGKGPIITMRLFSPYGYYEGADRLVPSVISACLKNRSPRLSSPECVRDFIFIEDVVEAFGKAVRSHKDIQGEVFNIGSGKQHSIRDIVSIIARLTGCKAHPVWGVVENCRIEPRHWQADMAKTKKVLKWQPRFSLEEGLARTIEWLKKNEGI